MFKFYQNIHVHIADYHCAKDQIKIEFQICYFHDLNLYFMTSLTAVLFLKRRLVKIAISPVLSTVGNDNSKSRYGNVI